ncbi:MAG: hypothetical protein ACR2OG_11265 [Gemmatimonadaceae bacterium]
MPKTGPTFNPADYAPVANRIDLFYQRYPTGRIVTRLAAKSDREVTFEARVYRGADDTRPAATGWASEREGDGDVNSVACLENTETSAIGRALANLGLAASPNRPSREEMQKAARMRSRFVGSESRPVQPLRDTPRAPVVAPLPKAEVASLREAPSDDAAFDATQARADLIQSVCRLLAKAERRGMRAPRVARYRSAILSDDTVPLSLLAQMERRLRRQLVAHALTARPAEPA